MQEEKKGSSTGEVIEIDWLSPAEKDARMKKLHEIIDSMEAKGVPKSVAEKERDNLPGMTEELESDKDFDDLEKAFWVA